MPAVERDPQRLVREHLQVGGEAVGALHVRHLDAVLDGYAGERVEPADAVEDVAAAGRGRHGRRRRLVDDILVAVAGADEDLLDAHGSRRLRPLPLLFFFGGPELLSSPVVWCGLVWFRRRRAGVCPDKKADAEEEEVEVGGVELGGDRATRTR